MKISLAQIRPFKGDINKNIEAHCHFINAAIDNKADAIFFPELSLTSYEPTLARELATTVGDDRLAIFQLLSNKGNITIGVGLPIISQKGVHISMIIFQPKQVTQVYSKQHLHNDELPYFVSGNGQLYITIQNKKLALAICYESLLSQHAEIAASGEADVYLASVAKSTNGVVKAYHHYPEIAKKHSMSVLVVNSVGYFDNFESAGSSAAWNDRGILSGKLDEKGEGLLIFDTETELATIISLTEHSLL